MDMHVVRVRPRGYNGAVALVLGMGHINSSENPVFNIDSGTSYPEVDINNGDEHHILGWPDELYSPTTAMYETTTQ